MFPARRYPHILCLTANEKDFSLSLEMTIWGKRHSRIAAFCPEYSCLQEMKDHYTRGGLGDVKVKRFLDNVMQETLRPIRERREYWEAHLEDVQDILKAGCEKAENTAAKTLDEVRRAMRINYFEDGNLLK